MNWKKLFVGFGMLIFCGVSWAWMFGYFALPHEFTNGDKMLQQWSAPGSVVISSDSVYGFLLGWYRTCFIMQTKS